MTGTALSALSAASSVAFTDKLYVVQTDGVGGVRATVSQLPGAYAGIYVAGGSTTQTTNAVAGTFDKMTGWATNGSSSNCTADAANDRIICTVAGTYYCSVNVSFSGTGSETYRLRLYNNTTAAAVAPGELERKLGAGGDVGSASILPQ